MLSAKLGSRARCAASRLSAPLLRASLRQYTPEVSAADFSASHKAPTRPMDVLFFGTSEFAVPILRALAAAREGPARPGATHPLVGRLEIVVPPKRAQSKSGQDVPMVLAARELDLPLHYVTKGTNFRMEGWDLPADAPRDVGVTASFGHMIPPRVIEQFSMGMINAHGSLLPLLKGASPIQTSLLKGLQETGVTTTTLHPTSIDSGRVLRATPWPIPADATYPQVVAALADVAAADTLAVLRDWDATLLRSQEQGEIIARDGAPPTALRRAPKLSPIAGRVDFAALSAVEAARVWRALATYRHVTSRIGARRVILSGVTVAAETDAAALALPETAAARALVSEGSAAGTAAYDAATQQIVVRCREGVVAVAELQYECKPVVSAHKFAMGLGIMKPGRRDRFTAETDEPADADAAA